MNWRIIAIPASLIPIIIIVIQFDIQIEDILKIGPLAFAGAVAAIMAKLGIQGLKFGYIARKYLGSFDSMLKLTGVRMGSEFIKFTTPMFVGAEFVVVYYLHKKGVHASKAMWIAILDIVTEVFAAGALSIMAGIFALISGAYVVATVVLATSVSITVLWVILFFLSSKRTLQVPKVIAFVVKTIAKEKGKEYVKQSNIWMKEVCDMSRENLHKKDTKKVLAIGFTLSTIAWILYGVSFMIIAHSTGFTIEFFDSVMAVMGANAIGNLPITIGGSGLAEFGIVAYLNNLDPFNFVIPENSVEWNAVIGWRVATYYIPIVITWILLVKLALTKYDKPTVSEK